MRPGRPARALIAAAVAILGLTALPSAVAASPPRASSAEEINGHLSEVTEAEAAAVAQLLETQERRAQLELGLIAIDKKVRGAEAVVAQIETELAALRDRIETTRAELRDARDRLNESAGGAYQRSQSGATYDRILAAQPKDLSSGKKYLAVISYSRSGLVDEIEELEQKLERQEEAVVVRRDAADSQRALLTDLRTAQREAVDVIAAQARIEEVQLFEISKRRIEFERELGVFQASSDSIGELLRARGDTAGVGNGKCDARPVPGAVGSGFGPRVHPVYGTVRQHNGLDMHAASGEPIKACRAGVVVIAGTQGGYGNTVVIDHGGGMATLYAHQSRLNVRVGQSVNAGDTIGFAGSTGLSTGPHLHFEVRLSGSPVDAAAYL